MGSRYVGLRVGAFVIAVSAFACGAMLAAQSAEPLERETFATPMSNGLPVDMCVNGIGSCGPMGAYEFCRSQGYEKALNWSSAPAPRTWVTGLNAPCQTALGVTCKSLRNVTCVRAAAPEGSRAFALPVFNDMPVDHCRFAGAECGQSAADQFCRSQDFALARSWKEVAYKQTWNIGSGQACQEGPDRQCKGLAEVVCTGGRASQFKAQIATASLPRFNSAVSASIPGAIAASPQLVAPATTVINTVWVYQALGQTRRSLSAEQYAHLVADVTATIAPYSRTARMADMTLRADEAETARVVAEHLNRLEKLLLAGDRLALAQDLYVVFHRYDPASFK